MVFVQERKSNGITYIYLDKSIRIGKKVVKVSKYLGRKADFNKEMIEQAIKKFTLEINSETLSLSVNEAKKKYTLSYPLLEKELVSLEEMNLKYKEIKKNINKLDFEDIKKRFVANFVFESNAIEGSSLTLKNFSEIIFEGKITGSADLREVHDARNSYEVFSGLFNGRKEITEDFIISLHKDIMKNIDNRTGYKGVPNIILGKHIRLTPPENVKYEMEKLISWYNKEKTRLYPLELAFMFHHKFECIHPFSDGNGRVGRMLLNYILILNGYYPIIIRKNQRIKYIKALEAADNHSYVLLKRFAIEKSKETYRKFFEVYYNYLK